MARFPWRLTPAFWSTFFQTIKILGLAFVAILPGMAIAAPQQHLSIQASLPPATVSVSYNGTTSASGGVAPYHYSVTKGSLPSGLGLNATTGVISGVPQQAGSYSFAVSAWDANGIHGDKSLAITVAGASISVSISPSSANVVSGGSQQFTAYVTGTSNTAVTWSATAGTISSAGLFVAPTTSSNLSVTVTATSVAQSSKHASAAVTVTPQSGVSITTTWIPPAVSGSSYSADLSATGGTPPYSWSVTSGALPTGIQLGSSTGLISGTTSQLGNFNFTVQVQDANGKHASQNFVLTVAQSTGNFDGPAELPRVYVQSTLADTPAPGATKLVPAGGDFQGALNAASCGDTIQLQAGATFTGNFNFPAKSCDDAHWIIVRTSAPDSSLPAEGTRMTPCYAGFASLPGRPAYACSSPTKVLATLFPKGFAGPIVLSSGASHYRLLGLEIARPAGTGAIISLVTLAGAADHIILDRVWMHGSPQDDTRRGINLSGLVYGAVVDSYLNDFHCTALTGTCTDAQTISGGSGTIPSGQWKIVDNFLEASGENILFGGGGATMTPTDIEIRRNHFFKPMFWMLGAPGFIGGVSGNPFIVKNHFELKNAARVLFEANILENNWGGFTQHGHSIALTPKSYVKPGTNVGVCPTCQVTDITIRYSTISHAGGGIVLANALSGNPPTVQALYGQRYSLHDLTIDDIDTTHYQKSTGGLFMVANSWATNVQNSITINHVTGFPDPNASALVLGDPVAYPKMWGFSFTNNIVAVGSFPVWSIGGGTANCVTTVNPALTLPACFSSYAFSSNALVAVPAAYPSSKWPAGNYFAANAATVQFVNYNNANGGNYTLQPSSPYKNAGSDGKDLGADISAIQAAISGVY